MSIYNRVAEALAEQGKRELAAKQAVDRARPVGEKRLDISFYSDAERGKPIEDGSFVRDGVTYSWRGARWAVWKVRWTGDRWQKYRRVSGPLNGVGKALERLVQECKATGMERVR